MKPQVSVVVPVYNEERFISKCIKSILNQTYKNFELIIVDDCSTDNTHKIIKSFKNNRIICISNKKNCGAYINRNIGIKKSRGEYIFFTDADCIADKNWIKEGYKTFKDNPKALGIQGITYYVSKDYKPTYSDKVVKNLNSGGNYITANIAYKKDILQTVGLFDERVRFGGDVALGTKVANGGKIIFNRKMTIYHSKDLWNIKSKLNSAKKVEDRITLFRVYKYKEGIHFRIIYPLNFLGCILPPLILLSFFIRKFRTLEDFKLFLVMYPYLILERVHIWKKAIQEKILLI